MFVNTITLFRLSGKTVKMVFPTKLLYGEAFAKNADQTYIKEEKNSRSLLIRNIKNRLV